MSGCLRVPDGPEVARLGLGAVALRWQRLGYAVLALGVGSKRPHKLFSDPDHQGQAGVHWATTDPAMVEHVWLRDRLAGIGIATGSASRLLVVDLDVKAGEDGIAEFASMVRAWSLPVPPAVVQHTPGGGQHLWFRLPEGIEVPGRIGIAPGIDIKSDGGYVAVYPSHVWVHSMDGGGALLPYRMNG